MELERKDRKQKNKKEGRRCGERRGEVSGVKDEAQKGKKSSATPRYLLHCRHGRLVGERARERKAVSETLSHHSPIRDACFVLECS